MSCNDSSFIDTIAKKLPWSRGAELKTWCEKKGLDYGWYHDVSKEKLRSIAMDRITYVMLTSLCKNDENLFWETVEELISQTSAIDKEVERLLASKGKKCIDGKLHPIRPIMLDPIKQMDSLEVLHKKMGFPNEFIREVREAYNSYTVKSDPKGALDRYRTVLEQLLKHIAQYAKTHHPNAATININFDAPWSVRNGLKELDFLHENEKGMVDNFYGWISDTSTHQWSWLASPLSAEFVMVLFPAWIAQFSERFAKYKEMYP